MRIIHTVIAGLLSPLIAFGQSTGTISGRVVSAEDSSALVGATVEIRNTTIGTSTGTDGSFSIRGVPPGAHVLLISMVGYQPHTTQPLAVEAGKDATVRIALQPSPIQTAGIVVTAGRHEQSLADVPTSMSIVDAASLEERHIFAADDALRYVPGVTLTQSQVSIRGSSGYSRGVGSRVLVLLDGLPLIAGDTGELTLEALPVFEIERIEVVKGAGSALYGSSALGGVINIITKEIPEEPETRWRIFGGFDDSPPYPQWDWSTKTRFLNGQFVSHAQRFGPVGIVAAGSRLLEDGFRENDYVRRYDGYLKMQYDSSPFERLVASGNIMWQRHGDFLWWKDLRDALRPADSQLGLATTSTRANGSLSYRRILSDRLTLEVKGMSFFGNWHEDSLAYSTANHSVSDVTNAEAQLTYISGGHVLTVGGGGALNHVDAGIFGMHDGWGGSAYGQEEYHFSEAMIATAGVRYDAQQTGSLTLRSQVSPKAGITWKPDGATALRASVNRGFRAPSIGEIYSSTPLAGGVVNIIPNPGLLPEQSWSYEIGGSHTFSEHVAVDAALFRSDIDDLIEAGFGIDSSGGTQKPVVRFANVTEARVEGGELSIETNALNRTLHLGAHYMYNWPYDVGQKDILKFRPRHVASLNASWSYDPVSLGADFRFMSRTDRIDETFVTAAGIVDGDERVPVYLLDARISGDLRSLGVPLRVGLEATNLLRYSYVELIGNVGQLRRFTLNCEGAF